MRQENLPLVVDGLRHYWRGRTKVLHCLRHAIITAMVKAGVTEYVVQDIVGHEKKGVTG